MTAQLLVMLHISKSIHKWKPLFYKFCPASENSVSFEHNRWTHKSKRWQSTYNHHLLKMFLFSLFWFLFLTYQKLTCFLYMVLLLMHCQQSNQQYVGQIVNKLPRDGLTTEVQYFQQPRHKRWQKSNCLNAAPCSVPPHGNVNMPLIYYTFTVRF